MKVAREGGAGLAGQEKIMLLVLLLPKLLFLLRWPLLVVVVVATTAAMGVLRVPPRSEGRRGVALKAARCRRPKRSREKPAGVVL